jgi:hypothetical protein
MARNFRIYILINNNNKNLMETKLYRVCSMLINLVDSIRLMVV